MWGGEGMCAAPVQIKDTNTHTHTHTHTAMLLSLPWGIHIAIAIHNGSIAMCVNLWLHLCR